MPELSFRKVKPLLVFKIPGQVDAVGGAVDRVMELIEEKRCVFGREFEVEVALLEAVANAVKHGCKGDAGKEVELRVLCREDLGLLVIIRDPGEGFDPGAVPSPVDSENLLKTHGRGVWLMDQMMDTVTFREGGRKVLLHKKPPGAKVEE